MKMKTLFAALTLLVLIVATTSCASSRKYGCPMNVSTKPVVKEKQIG
jgi:hypothetical protein